MSKLKSMTSNLWYKLTHKQPIDLTVTMEGTGSATAHIIDNIIRIICAAAQVDKYVQVTTPIGFTVRDVKTRHDNATAVALTVSNGGDDISDALAIAATDKVIDRAASIDDANNSFEAGDDDLRVEIATGAFTGVVEIEIEPLLVS